MDIKGKFDVRILTLKKFDLYNLDDNSDKSGENYISAHYFNGFEFTHVKTTSKKIFYFIKSSYEKINCLRDENNKLKNSQRICQNIILFGYLKEKNFWKLDAAHVFITMIKTHDTHDIMNLKTKIEEILKNNKLIYAVYYTLDFSDLVLIVKDVNINEFQNILWNINFSSEYKCSELIKDSITLFGIKENCFNKLENNKKVFLKKNKLHASMSFGVQDVSLLAELKHFMYEEKYKFIESAQFGRRDVTFFFKNINEFKFIELYKKISYISSSVCDFKHKFLGLKIITYADTQNIDVIKKIPDFDTTDENYNNKKQNFEQDTDKSLFETEYMDCILKCVQEYKNLIVSEHYIDVSEIYNSIHELSRNRFSEEFLISIYYAFYLFLKIFIQKKATEEKEILSEFCSDFFSSLNMLLHCTMHGEKCFVQSAPFNSIIIDIPPKILAYYTAIAYNITKCMEDGNDQLFSFIFIPSFSDKIEVVPISPGGDKDDRLICVNINEKIFYDPYRVILTMFHEVAHYVGDKTRCREERKKCIFKALVRTRLAYFGMSDEALECSNLLEKIALNQFDKKNNGNYMSDILEFLYDTNFLRSIFLDESYYFEGFDFEKKLSDYIDPDDMFYGMINALIQKKADHKDIDKILSGILSDKVWNHDEYNDNYILQIEDMLSAYSEAYADLALIIYTNIDQKQYLKMINEECGLNLRIEDITSDKLYKKMNRNYINLELSLRLRCIFYICYKNNQCNEDYIKYKCNDIEKREIRIYNIMYKQLVEYLKICYKAILSNKEKHNNNPRISFLDNLSEEFSENWFFSLNDYILKYKKEIFENIKNIEKNKK